MSSFSAMRQQRQTTSKSATMKCSSNHDNYGFQQQFGRTNHSRDSSGDDCTNFCEAKGPMSPTAWMCEVTGKKMSQLCRPFMSGNTNVQLGKENNYYHKRPPRSENSDTSIASWRERAAKSILSAHNSDEEDSEDEKSPDSTRRKNASMLNRGVGTYGEHFKTPSPESFNSPAHTAGEADSADDEPRIIAPNVDKISPISVIEVRLQSIRECVTILCSVDVLKMKSVFFYEVLNEQEENRISKDHGQNQTWREPLLIPEVSPFEAAAFIESLHEGRQLCKGEWNYCWARLSVSWQVQELVAEYAQLIKAHFSKLLNYVQQNNWRTNSNVLVGARVAIFRKTSTLMPMVITGVAIEAAATTSYAKLRVVFDPIESKTMAPSINSCISPIQVTRATSPTRKSHPSRDFTNPPGKFHLQMGNDSSAPVYGDISDPFWIQLPQPLTSVTVTACQPISYAPALSQYNALPPPQPTLDATKVLPAAYSMWSDPDELFIAEMKKHITVADKTKFWEMAKAIMELPKLSEHCDSAIRNSKDLAAILKRVEFKFLWSADAPDLLPKDAASELVSAAYVGNY